MRNYIVLIDRKYLLVKRACNKLVATRQTLSQNPTAQSVQVVADMDTMLEFLGPYIVANPASPSIVPKEKVQKVGAYAGDKGPMMGKSY